MLQILAQTAMVLAIISLAIWVNTLEKRIHKMEELFLLREISGKLQDAIKKTKDPKKIEKIMEEEFGDGTVKVIKLKKGKK